MKPKNSKEDFRFCPELFGYKSSVADFLSNHDYHQYQDYKGIDVAHDTYGVEVTGISDEETALAIRTLTIRHVKDQMWIESPWNRCYQCDDGWVVEVFRDPDDQSDDWWK